MSFKFTIFKPGSYILVEDQKTHNEFYIIVNGKLKSYKNINPSQSNMLGPGDFFGLESAMSRQTPLETVIAMTECKLIEVPYTQFGTLIQKNAPVALKIIRSFSFKLRAFDKAITNHSKQDNHTEGIQNEEIYKLAEFWQSKNETSKAIYAFRSYLKYEPSGYKAEAAKNHLQMLDAPLSSEQEVDSKLTRSSLQENEILFCEHETGEDCFIIQEGRIKIIKIVHSQETILAILKPGDIFGEMAILEGKPRTATAIAAEEVRLMRINKANFQELVQAQPILATKLITLLSERIWVAYRQLSNLFLKSVEARLYDLLLTFLYKEHVPILSRVSYSFTFGGSDLLKMAGLDPQENEHYLMSIFAGDILNLHEGKIICSDLEKLRDRVFFERKQNLSSMKKSSS